MDAKVLLLFTALASTAAFGQGKYPPAPTDPYMDKDSGFVFPPVAGSFQRTNVLHPKDSTALWVDYRDFTPGAKFSIRIILRQPVAGPKGIASCREDMKQEQERVKRWPYFAGFLALKRPEFAGYTSEGWAEEFGPPGGTGFDYYYYCSKTKAWMAIYGFQRAKDSDVIAQEIAFIRSVKPPGT